MVILHISYGGDIVYTLIGYTKYSDRRFAVLTDRFVPPKGLTRSWPLRSNGTKMHSKKMERLEKLVE